MPPSHAHATGRPVPKQAEVPPPAMVETNPGAARPQTRRRFLASTFAMTAAVAAGQSVATTPPALAQSGEPPGGLRDWQEFKRRFVTADGRVIDTGNGSCTHTEAQGLGLLFSVAFDDPATFDSLFDWLSRHLRRSNDALHGWRFQPDANPHVTDWNNATDGDVFIAAALLRAAKRWGRPALAQAGGAIAHDILRLLVREVGSRTVLLPGAQGFETAHGITVNPSYYVFPLLDEVAAVAPSPVWASLRRDGEALIEQGRYGAWQLPPDWLHISRADGALSPDPRWPARFSYDAIRVPLYLQWGRVVPDATRDAFTSWAASRPVQPAWVDLTTGDAANYPASPGMVAIARVAAAAQRGDLKADVPSGFPAMRTSTDYYSAALIMLARLAWQETRGA